MGDVLDTFEGFKIDCVDIYRYGANGEFQEGGNEYIVGSSRRGENAYNLVHGVYGFLDRGILSDSIRASPRRFREIFEMVAPQIPYVMDEKRIPLSRLQLVLFDVSQREAEKFQGYLREQQGAGEI